MPEPPRDHLPVPDVTRVGLTTYDAKDPDTTYPPIEPLRLPLVMSDRQLLFGGMGRLSETSSSASRTSHTRSRRRSRFLTAARRA